MYELFNLPRDLVGEPREAVDGKRGIGQAAVFIARNRFAVLDKSAGVIVNSFLHFLNYLDYLDMITEVAFPHCFTNISFYFIFIFHLK